MATVRDDARELFRLAVPVVLTQLLTMLMGLIDTLMVARLGTEALASAALGTVWVWGTLLPVLGVLFGLDPIVTQAHGAHDHERVSLGLQRGLVLAVFLSLPLMGLWRATGFALELVGQEPRLVRAAHGYVQMQLFSAAPFLVFSALRQWLQGRGIMRPALSVMVIANGLNVVFNYALIFGHLGAPRLGLDGAGLATGLSRLVMLVALVALVAYGRLLGEGWTGWCRAAVSPAGLREVLSYGLPASAQITFEVWGFHALTFLAGRLGAAALAAHTIVLNIASFTFMVPFGLSMAAATRVGNLTGAGRGDEARRAGWLAVASGAAVMACFGAALLLLRRQIPLLWQPEPAVLAFAVAILPIAAAFQVLDGLQVVATGALRGIGDTLTPAVANFIGFYLLAIPFGAWLAFRAGASLAGLWWGVTLALATTASILVVRLRTRL